MNQKIKAISSTLIATALLVACSSQETVIGLEPTYDKHGDGGCQDGYVYASDERCYPQRYYPDYEPGRGDYDSPNDRYSVTTG